MVLISDLTMMIYDYTASVSLLSFVQNPRLFGKQAGSGSWRATGYDVIGYYVAGYEGTVGCAD